MNAAPNGCAVCQARLNGIRRADGSRVIFCYHVAFEDSHPGDGRPIPAYPRTPEWCPGMVPFENGAQPS